jgi:hypothetical protein
MEFVANRLHSICIKRRLIRLKLYSLNASSPSVSARLAHVASNKRRGLSDCRRSNGGFCRCDLAGPAPHEYPAASFRLARHYRRSGRLACGHLVGNFPAGAGTAVSILTGFPSPGSLCRDATGNVAALAMNDSRHGTAKRCPVFVIDLREFLFADVFNVFGHTGCPHCSS